MDMLMYSRQFDPHVTKELRLYGFNGNDLFKIDEDVHSKIKIRMIGGGGDDTFDIRGRVPNYIYDLNTEGNIVLARRRTRNMMSSNPTVNNYDEKEKDYTIWRFPNPELGYNFEDGFLVGVGINVKTFAFRKTPYSTYQNLTTLFAITDKAYQIKYTGDFINLFHRTDIVADGEIMNPTLNNFFGIGNETKIIRGTDIHYYRIRYNDFDGSVLLRKRYFQNVLSIGLGPAFYYYSNKYGSEKSDPITVNPALVGLDSASLYTPKLYAGGKLSVKVDNLNSKLFPTRGISWITDFTSMADMNKNNNSITKLESNMAVYASLSEHARVVAVLRLGGGHIFSQQYEYFQALTLGDNNDLRGYLKNRFAGSSLAYTDIELRVKICDVKSYVMPGAFGIVGFNDVGRVWVKNDQSKIWHDGYGTGLYYTPFNMAIISATIAFSNEESLFNFTIGTKINLTF